jgi:hypothetical protein
MSLQPESATKVSRASTCTSATASVLDLPVLKQEDKPDDALPSRSENATIVDIPSSSSTESPSDPVPQWLKVVLLVAFSVANFLDVAGISTLFSAVPVLSEDLGLSGNQGVWLLSAYQLTFSAFLLLSGRLTDIYNPSESLDRSCLRVSLTCWQGSCSQ